MLGCAVLGIVTVLAAVGVLTWFSAHMIRINIPYVGPFVHVVMGGVYTIMGWFMLPVLIVLIAGMFEEQTIHRVETIYYPDRTRDQSPRLWPDLKHDIRFTIFALFLNLMILPFYLLGIGAVLSLLLNSYLLGREFFESAAGYHTGKTQARILGRKHRAVIYLGGFVITGLTLIPVINLFMPIIAIVWMVHVYHHLENTALERS